MEGTGYEMFAESRFNYSDLEEIKYLHDDNKLASNQYSDSKQMQEKLMFKCPLNRLYTVVASCNYNSQNPFCPVLVEIKDEVALL